MSTSNPKPQQPVLVFICDHCNRKAAELRDGKLVLFLRHDNSFHETIIILPQQSVQPQGDVA